MKTTLDGGTDGGHELETLLHDLTAPHAERTVVERLEGATRYRRNHEVPVPSLLDQLRGRMPVRGEGRRGPSGASVPVALEAIDLAVRIDLEVARWVRDLGEDDPGDTEECLRLLAKLVASVHRCDRRTPARDEAGVVACCTWHRVADDVRSWWLSARVVSGWDGRPWSPDASCPVCEHRGGLRVRLEDKSAVCTGCRAAWGPESIGVLAEHIASGRGDRGRAS